MSFSSRDCFHESQSVLRACIGDKTGN